MIEIEIVVVCWEVLRRKLGELAECTAHETYNATELTSACAESQLLVWRLTTWNAAFPERGTDVGCCFRSWDCAQKLEAPQAWQGLNRWLGRVPDSRILSAMHRPPHSPQTQKKNRSAKTKTNPQRTTPQGRSQRGHNNQYAMRGRADNHCFLLLWIQQRNGAHQRGQTPNQEKGKHNTRGGFDVTTFA